MNFRNVMGMVGRIVLSGLVVWLLAACLNIFLKSSFHRGDGGADPVVQREKVSARGRAVSRGSTSLWPHFPASSPVRRKELVVNGIDYITESWETCAPRETVLDYYKSQMAARRWRDVTEESYNLKPEVHREKSGDAGLQDQQFLDVYRKVMGSCLALNRGAWSVHVATEESQAKAGWIMVTICGAAIPSINDFADPWLSAPDVGGAAKPRDMDFVERSGDQRYQTKITYQQQAPVSAFREALANLQRGNWRPMFASSMRPGQAGHSALLVKGDQYGSLAVTPSRNGRGASVAWTEVSPEK